MPSLRHHATPALCHRAISWRCLAVALLVGESLWRLPCVAAAEFHESPDYLLRLNEVFLASVEAETPPPALTARNLAIFHLAIHQAGDAAAGQGTSRLLPMIRAGEAVGSSLFPARNAVFQALLREAMGPMLAGPDLTHQLTLGAATAQAWLRHRESDASATTVHYVPSEAAGQWRRTPPGLRPPELPHWRAVTPFLMASGDAFRPGPPPALDSKAYTDAWNEVRHLGSATSTTRTADQTLAARFWSDFSYTPGPPGHWNQIACLLIREKKLPLREAASLLARLNLALADAGVACWDCKYHYNAWRPLTAIHRADQDGNPDTGPDPEWNSFLPSPPHPDYPSGHATFSGAAATILAVFFGSDAVPFRITSVSTPGITRKYAGFAVCAREITDSRVWCGIHFAFAGHAGLSLGQQIGKWTSERPLRTLPLSPPPEK